MAKYNPILECDDDIELESIYWTDANQLLFCYSTVLSIENLWSKFFLRISSLKHTGDSSILSLFDWSYLFLTRRVDISLEFEIMAAMLWSRLKEYIFF